MVQFPLGLNQGWIQYFLQGVSRKIYLGVGNSAGETTTKSNQDIVIMSYKMTVKLQAFAKRIECEAPQQSP